MKILGIDPGTATTGYSLIEYNGDKPILLEASAFETLPEFSLPDRLLTLHGLIDEKIKETKPDCLVIEKLFFKRIFYNV